MTFRSDLWRGWGLAAGSFTKMQKTNFADLNARLESAHELSSWFSIFRLCFDIVSWWAARDWGSHEAYIVYGVLRGFHSRGYMPGWGPILDFWHAKMIRRWGPQASGWCDSWASEFFTTGNWDKLRQLFDLAVTEVDQAAAPAQLSMIWGARWILQSIRSSKPAVEEKLSTWEAEAGRPVVPPGEFDPYRG